MPMQRREGASRPSGGQVTGRLGAQLAPPSISTGTGRRSTRCSPDIRASAAAQQAQQALHRIADRAAPLPWLPSFAFPSARQHHLICAFLFMHINPPRAAVTPAGESCPGLTGSSAAQRRVAPWGQCKYFLPAHYPERGPAAGSALPGCAAAVLGARRGRGLPGPGSTLGHTDSRRARCR